MIRINLLKKENEKAKRLAHKVSHCAMGLTLGAQLVLGSYVHNYLNSLRPLYRPASYVSCQPKESEPGKSFELSKNFELGKSFELSKSFEPGYNQFTLASTGNNGFSLASFKPKSLEEYLKREEAENARPEILEQLELEKGEYVLLVNKETRTAQLYKLDYVLVDQAGVSTGRNPGNKERSGDNKTPEGIFEVVSVEQSSGWLHNGRLAYGPYFARLSAGSWDAYGNHNPDGWSPIGVHGTDEPEKIGSLASEGCVRTQDEFIKRCVEQGYIKKGVKVVIVDDAGNKVEEMMGGGVYARAATASKQE
jgi:hypothetical protein